MLSSMYKCYQEGKLCDVNLLVAGNEMKAHKLVLNAFSWYFRGLFEYSSEDKVEIRQFDEATMKCILHFAYTGKLRLDTSNVLRVLVACDFLQLVELDFIQESVFNHLKNKVNETNLPAMLVISEQFHAQELKDHLVKFAASNFASVCLMEDFFKIPFELLVEILQCKFLVANISGKDFLPSATEQEDFILDIVLKYVYHQCEDVQEPDHLLSKLIPYVRCLFLSPMSLQKLEQNCGCASLMLVRQAKGEIKPQDDHLFTLWGTLREASLPKERSGKKHAHQVYVGPVQKKFGDEPFTDESSLYIKGMKIWIRLWDDRPVVGGLMIFYSNGESPIYGGYHDSSECHEFHLADDERIIKAEIRSGWMIDNLRFFTNKDKELRPYGGDGGRKYTDQRRGVYGFLSYLKGAVVLTQQELGISHLQLIWREVLVDCDQSDSDNVQSNSLRSSEDECSTQLSESPVWSSD